MKKQLIFALLFTALGSPLFAQKEPDTKREEETKESTPVTPKTQKVADYGSAINLARYGYANNCALCLITAADMIYKLGVTPLNAEAKANPAAGTPTVTKTEKPNPTDPARLLADAKQMAKGDANLLALANKVRPVLTRGPVGGQRVTRTRVEAGSVDVFRIAFYGQEPAAVVVRGDGDTDLDLYIYDSNGNLIASDDDSSDYCAVSWTPRYTGTFIIRVKNRGNVYNRYAMATN
ncbi:PPC domain-containing protein [Spirosoma gilvum]